MYFFDVNVSSYLSQQAIDNISESQNPMQRDEQLG